MSADKKLDRRQFFERALMLGAASFGAGAFLSACKSEAKVGGGAKATPPSPEKKADCTDESALSEQEKSTRNSLQYKTKSEKPERNCANCKLFVKKDPCNGCTVLPGPVAAEGWCSAWVPRG